MTYPNGLRNTLLAALFKSFWDTFLGAARFTDAPRSPVAMTYPNGLRNTLLAALFKSFWDTFLGVILRPSGPIL